MKRLFIVIIILLYFCLSGKSQDYITGAGARIGDGISATIKHFVDQDKALELIMDFRAGLSIIFVMTVHQPLSRNQSRLNWYYGFGGYIYFSNTNDKDTFVGIAGAIGVEYTLPNKKFAFSMDWNPVISLIGDLGGFNGRYGGVTARYILQ